MLHSFAHLSRMDDREVSAIRTLVANLFGAFHSEVSIVGVFFHDERTPVTIYPLPYNQFKVAVLLPSHQANEPLARLVHLSHELVHCLMPNGQPPHQATVLEEGLAEHAKIYLSEMFYRGEFPDFDFKEMLVGKYRDAFGLVEELVETHSLEGMREGIRNLREETGLPFAKITADHLAVQFPNASRSLMDRLCARFH
ncbi:hypothetical protein [Ensifer sp. 22460]|uniref:hypothetical protein n=1 Tax=Ensifer sp. 22460 TaxID=3453922 RepID=UPI003F8785F0